VFHLADEQRELIRLAAEDKGVDENMICTVCLATIQVMSFKGTAVCSELCRKRRDNEYTPMDQVVQS
jgi:hypothetical protein